MRLDQIAIQLRQRTPYEAIDLGYAMVRTWSRSVFANFAAVFIPAAIIINLLCYANPLIAALILWWLKPAFDRVVLHTLAGATFGATPSVSDTWRALPTLWWRNDLLAALTWRRLSPSRTFNLAVSQLERQRGKPARQRRQALGREGSGPDMMLIFISVHFEILLLMTIYLFADIFIPSGADTTTGFNPLSWINQDPTTFQEYVSNAVGVLTVFILEPFFVAAGFALYLHTRTVLEGWDIEQAFRLMNARLTAAAETQAKHAAWAANTRKAASFAYLAPVAMLLAASLMVIGPSAVEASTLAPPPTQNTSAPTTESASAPKDDASNTPPDKAFQASPTTNDGPDPSAVQTEPVKSATPETGAKEIAEQVLSDPIFGEVKETWRIRYIGPFSEKNDPEPPKRYPWLESFGKFLAYAFRFLAWVIGGALVILLLYFLAKYLDGRDWRDIFGANRAQPDMLFGLDVRPESLPDDVAASARAALAAGDVRLALSLLYRGALVWLIQDGKIDIAKGDTEGVCVRHVASKYGGAANAKPSYFADLVRAWQSVAYGHESLPTAHITSLIDAWAAHFQLRTTRTNGETDTPSSPAQGASA